MCTLAAASTRPEKLVLRLQSRAPSADCVFVPSAAAAHDATGSVLAPPAHHHHPMKPGPSIVLQDLIDRHNTNAQNGKSPSAYMYKTSGRLGGGHSQPLVSFLLVTSPLHDSTDKKVQQAVIRLPEIPRANE